MHTSVYILHRQKIIVSAAELAVRPPAYPSLLETFIFGLESTKKGTGTQVLNRNQQESTGTYLFACLAPGYIPDPTLGGSSIPKE